MIMKLQKGQVVRFDYRGEYRHARVEDVKSDRMIAYDIDKKGYRTFCFGRVSFVTLDK